MKAAICTKFGGSEVIEIREIEKPIPKNNEVLIKIRATTVTTYDCWVRGFSLSSRLIALLFGMNFGLKRPKDPILGTEFAGEIEAVGNNVQNFKPAMLFLVILACVSVHVQNIDAWKQMEY